jgi:hypothetical protein
MKANAALVALLVVAWTAAADAAPLRVVIEKLNPAAATCGISEPQLEAVAVRTLGASPYAPDADAGGWLNVRVTVAQSRRSACTARIAVQMKASVKPASSAGDASHGKPARIPVVVLCDKRGDFSAPRDGFPVEVESALEYTIRQCLGSLRY